MKKYFRTMTDRTIDKLWNRIKHRTKVHTYRCNYKFGEHSIEQVTYRLHIAPYSSIDIYSIWYRKATWLCRR